MICLPLRILETTFVFHASPEMSALSISRSCNQWKRNYRTAYGFDDGKRVYAVSCGLVSMETALDVRTDNDRRVKHNPLWHVCKSVYRPKSVAKKITIHAQDRRSRISICLYVTLSCFRSCSYNDVDIVEGEREHHRRAKKDSIYNLGNLREHTR